MAGKDKDRERYWIKYGNYWREVTKTEFILEKRLAGFEPKSGNNDELATASFGSYNFQSRESIEGRTTYGPITIEKYGWDEEFFKAATKS